MKVMTPGDVIKDNFGRKGVVVSWTRRPARGWLKIQTDARMRKARGRWVRVCVFDSGSVLVPVGLARRIRRATVDDLVGIMGNYEGEGAYAILREMVDGVRFSAARVPPPKRAKR